MPEHFFFFEAGQLSSFFLELKIEIQHSRRFYS